MKTKIIIFTAALGAVMQLHAQSLRDVLISTGVKGGLIVHVGCGAGAETASLHLNESCLVQGLAKSQAEVDKARTRLSKLDIYGNGVMIDLLPPNYLPYIDNLVNVVICEDVSITSREEIMRVLVPNGVACIKSGGKWNMTIKPRPAEIDDWTHYLHAADGNAVADDTIVAAPRHMQWWATPKWLRNHHKLASISSVVSGNGRLFCIMDESSCASMAVPPEWSVVGRDAFNGLELWKTDMPTWASTGIGFRSGPTQLPRLLVTDGENVFVPMGLNAPVSKLDAGTGKVLHTYARTSPAEEIILDKDILIVLSGDTASAQSGARNQRFKKITALNTKTEKPYWQIQLAGNDKPIDQTIATDGDRVYFQVSTGITALDIKTGKKVWSTGKATAAAKEEPAAKGGKKKKKPKRYSSGFGSTLVVKDGVVLSARGGKLLALSSKDGKQMWETKIGTGFRSPPDVLVVDGLVWVGPNFSEGLDIRTGQSEKKTIPVDELRTAGHHHRCYREKATSRFLLGGYRGIELYDLKGKDYTRNNWVRGLCQYGIMPCNGLIYAPSHACGCYMEAKLNGFWALAPDRKELTDDSPRLEKGPAYDSLKISEPVPGSWPMLMQNPLRNNATTAKVSVDIKQQWKIDLGNSITPPVVSGETLIVADTDKHQIIALDVGTGRERWRFTAGGRIDSTPTIAGNAVVAGSADGYVYCLNIKDGALAWKFRGAPIDQRTISDDQIESVWPVHGSVMVENGKAYFAAGRSSYIDGGIRVFALDVKTGAVKAQSLVKNEQAGPGKAGNLQKFEQNATDDKTFNAPDKSDAFSMDGAKTDIFVSNGSHVFLRNVMFDQNLNRTRKATRHIYSTSSLLDDAENHRSHWLFGSADFSRLGVAYSWTLYGRKGIRKLMVPRGVMLAYDTDNVWTVQRPKGNGSYTLVDYENHPFGPEEPSKPDFSDTKNPDLVKKKWTSATTERPRAMVITENAMVIGGIPDFKSTLDSLPKSEGFESGVITLHSKADGSIISEIKLACAPTWNGIAVTDNGMFVTTVNGDVICLR